MSSRLLSLLTDVERALCVNDPAPDDGAWDTRRLVNFHQGLARLTISNRSAERVTTARGAILLQSFALADGSCCVKATLSWQGSDNSSVYAVYAKPETSWPVEAGQIAIKWLDGRLAISETSATASPVSSIARGESVAELATAG